ncbi:MAG: helical backbone metal receptor [Planctomycetota bacterium]|nr:helical backbone metal receptor [Planctomycetota bacterium]
MRRIFLACLIFAACARTPSPVTDSAATRVVAIAPGTEANLFALGLGSSLIGVSDFCSVPEAAHLPRVGGQTNPNLERIAALSPTLVLVQGRHPKVKAWTAGAAVEFHAFPTDSIPGWKLEVRWLGERFSKAAESERLIAEVERALAQLGSFGMPRRTLLLIARRSDQASGIIAAGPGTFLSELLAAAGGVNVLPEGGVAYPSINEESLIRLDPEAVIEFRPGAVDAGDALDVWRASFPALAAVRAGRIGAVIHLEALMPGPRMHEVAQAMHALLR